MTDMICLNSFPANPSIFILGIEQKIVIRRDYLTESKRGDYYWSMVGTENVCGALVFMDWICVS